ncbi:unnamed protein product [Lasius platythorax]|uniref:Uncharacterized protein n=1 Tax=Lasius platythorax TaxID=488582 RepID=A0AAV2PB96_9HYME
MVTLSTLGFPLVHVNPENRPRRNSPYVEAPKRNSGNGGTTYGEAPIERGDDPGLRSDRGADSVPYYGNRRFSASKGLEERRSVDTARKAGREEREY